MGGERPGGWQSSGSGPEASPGGQRLLLTEGPGEIRFTEFDVSNPVPGQSKARLD